MANRPIRFAHARRCEVGLERIPRTIRRGNRGRGPSEASVARPDEPCFTLWQVHRKRRIAWKGGPRTGTMWPLLGRRSLPSRCD